jgi:hypothetical protein
MSVTESQKNIDYRIECLKINPELKILGGRYGGLYRIVEYQENGFKPISSAWTSSFLAWKDCYKKIKKREGNGK